MTSVRVPQVYEDNKTYPILVKMSGGGSRAIVEMLGRLVNAHNERVEKDIQNETRRTYR